MCIHLYPCTLVKSVLWDSKEVTIGVYKETAAKSGRAIKRHERSKAHGRPDADLGRRIVRARNGVEGHSARDGRYITSHGATGHGGVDRGSPRSDMAGYDEGKGSADPEVPDVIDWL